MARWYQLHPNAKVIHPRARRLLLKRARAVFAVADAHDGGGLGGG